MKEIMEWYMHGPVWQVFLVALIVSWLLAGSLRALWRWWRGRRGFHARQPQQCPECGRHTHDDVDSQGSCYRVRWYKYSGRRLNTLACVGCGHAMEAVMPPHRASKPTKAPPQLSGNPGELPDRQYQGDQVTSLRKELLALEERVGKLEAAKTPIAPTEPTWTPSVVYHNPDALWPVFGRIDKVTDERGNEREGVWLCVRKSFADKWQPVLRNTSTEDWYDHWLRGAAVVAPAPVEAEVRVWQTESQTFLYDGKKLLRQTAGLAAHRPEENMLILYYSDLLARSFLNYLQELLQNIGDNNLRSQPIMVEPVVNGRETGFQLQWFTGKGYGEWTVLRDRHNETQLNAYNCRWNTTDNGTRDLAWRNRHTFSSPADAAKFIYSQILETACRAE